MFCGMQLSSLAIDEVKGIKGPKLTRLEAGTYPHFRGDGSNISGSMKLHRETFEKQLKYPLESGILK